MVDHMIMILHFYNNPVLHKVWGKKTDMLYELSVFNNDVCYSSSIYLNMSLGRQKAGDSKNDKVGTEARTGAGTAQLGARAWLACMTPWA